MNTCIAQVCDVCVSEPLDVNTPIWMRGTGYATAAFVIESAMDELAQELGVDPIELRVRNEPEGDESPASRSQRDGCASATR
jgi:CO/xanthine dehydrogenase Mo-binding subunit